MRIKLKLVDYALALVLLLCVLPQLATPAEAAIYSGTCGENLTWELYTGSGTLYIEGSGEMDNYSDSSDAPWYDYRVSIKWVTIYNSVTSMGEWAFYSCPDLTTVTICDGMTSIGRNAFENCTALTTVTIPDSVISIGNLAFYDCSSLTSVTIPDRLTSIGYGIFWGCSSLTSITIPDSVMSIDQVAFSDCDSLDRVYISDLSAWCKIEFGCTDYGYYSSNPLHNGADLYLNGGLVEDLVIPNSVTSICNAAFCGCTSLTTVTIPDSVTSIGTCAFHNCDSLTSVTIPDSVTEIGDEARVTALRRESALPAVRRNTCTTILVPPAK